MKHISRLTPACALTITLIATGCGAENPRALDVQFQEVWRIGGGSLDDANEDSLGGFGIIRALETDADGNLYVLDASFERIQKFSAEGEEIRKVTLALGEGPGEVQSLNGLAVAGDGRMFVLSGQSRTVSVFDQVGRFESEFETGFRPIQVDVRGNHVLVASLWLSPDSILHAFDMSGVKIRSLLPRPENWQEVFTSGNFGRFVSREDGRILFSYPLPYRIVEIDAEGRQLVESTGQPEIEGEMETVPSEIGGTITRMHSRSHGLAVLPGGYVLNAVQEEEDEFLDLFSPDLEFIRRTPLVEIGLEGIVRMTGDGTGNVFIDPGAEIPVIVKLAVTISDG